MVNCYFIKFFVANSFSFLLLHHRVINANPILEPRKVLPLLKTDEPICPDGKLACGNGECIDKELFCNGKPECKDESDENSCSKYMIDFVFFY